MTLREHGIEHLPAVVSPPELAALHPALFAAGRAGTRCLLDDPGVRRLAQQVRATLYASAHLPAAAVAIQAIAFDKTPDANWKVTWHQDLMFPFARPVTAAGFDLATKKDDIDYARPPASVLEDLLAVRLHLDPCDATNGPLRISPGSHRHGILPAVRIPEMVTHHGEHTCLARLGDAFLLKPLVLHASSPATTPRHRRVLHFVYYSGAALPEPWHRSI